MKRLFACLFIVALPAMTSPTLQHTPGSEGPFATVALAGHSTSADRAECPCQIGPDGVCPCCGYALNFIRTQNDEVVQRGLPVSDHLNSDSDLSPSAVLFLLALIAWGKILA